MRLSLIGMSGTGKSHWSERLAESGFTHYSCDRLIAARLGDVLRESDGCHMMQMADWLGFPHDPGYDEREAMYLAHEIDVLTEIVGRLEDEPERPGENVVIDTTGSVVYTGAGLLERLRRCTTVVYLSVPFDMRRKLCRAYIANPRPVLWRGLFQPRPGETDHDALARCYAELLASRQRQYEQLADVTIPYEETSARWFDAAQFIASVASRQA